jgi:hypothetical protein
LSDLLGLSAISVYILRRSGWVAAAPRSGKTAPRQERAGK